VFSRSSSARLAFVTAGILLSAALATGVSAQAKKKPAPKADAKAGKTAFAKEGCSGCHKTKDYKDGGAAGPDLSIIGKEHKAEQITAYIKKPKAGSIMPAYKGPHTDNIAAYLVTQK